MFLTSRSVILNRVFHNPFYASASVFAKLASSIATLIWAASVLWSPHAIRNSAYAWIERYVDEDWIAGPLTGICLLHIAWLMLHWAPRPYGIAGYFVLMVWWITVFYSVIFAGSPQPTALMGSATAAGLSIFACLSWPRDGKPA